MDYDDLYQLQQTKKILRGQRKNILNQPYTSCDLHPLITFLPVLITDFFSVKGNFSSHYALFFFSLQELSFAQWASW